MASGRRSLLRISCLLIVLASASIACAGDYFGKSGPYSISLSSDYVDNMAIGQPKTESGENSYVMHVFNIVSDGSIVGWVDILHFEKDIDTDPVPALKAIYPGNGPQEGYYIQIDGRDGAEARGYSSLQNNHMTYAGIYYLDERTMILINAVGDNDDTRQRFLDILNTIHASDDGSNDQIESFAIDKNDDGDQPLSNKPRGLHTELVCKNRLCYNMWTTHYDWCYRCEYEVVNG